MSRWVTANFDSPEWRAIKNEPACYAVYLDGYITYVGSTNDLRHRLNNHKFRYGYSNYIFTPWGEGLTGLIKRLVVKYRPSQKYGDWAMVELRLIRRLRPRFNKLGKAVSA